MDGAFLNFVRLGSLAILVALVGCSNKKSTQSEDVILRAYRLIDEQRTDEAIDLLEECRKAQPKNEECQIVLASAYAHKAGIKIQKFVPLVNDANRFQKLQEAISKRAAKDEEPVKKDNQEVPQKGSSDNPNKANGQEISNASNEGRRLSGEIAALIGAIQFLNQLSLALTLFADIPEVAVPDRAYLEHSIALLAELGDHRKKYATVYKVLLEIVLLKHVLTNDLLGSATNSDPKVGPSCELDLEKLILEIKKVANLVFNIANGVSRIDPRQRENLKSMALNVKTFVEELATYLMAASILDEISKKIGQEAMISSGLGHLLKCPH